MSFDDLHSSNGRREIVDIELDVRLLGSLAESEDTPADDSELLARLDTAVTMAGGVEAKLDEILGQLDDLITSLEPKDIDEPQQVTIPRSEPQSERPPSEQS
jgi:predicted nucleotidyltransferase